MFSGSGAKTEINQQFPENSGSGSGVNVALESTAEWQIQEIGFDGQEKYITPLVFSDHVAKLAHKVQWRELVGSKNVYDDPNICTESDQDDDENGMKKQKLDDKSQILGPKPGPWQSVAKYLHHSLQQMSVLLDTLGVIQQQNYLIARPVADHREVDPGRVQKLEQESRHFQWIAKRKTLLEAVQVFEKALKIRRLDSQLSDVEQFLNDLTRLRENWRVKKIGNVIIGDLGYRTYGPKFLPNEMFEIQRRTLEKSDDNNEINTSNLMVILPRDLVRRTILTVSIEKDDHGVLFCPDSLTDKNSIEVDDKLEETDGKAEELSRKLPWTQSLKWAQETLIFRDIFALLTKEASEMNDKFSVLKNGVLIIALHGEYVLKISVENLEEKMETQQINRDLSEYLTESLRRMFVNDQNARLVDSQRQFTTIPLLEVSLFSRMTHPQALTAEHVIYYSGESIPMMTASLLPHETTLQCVCVCVYAFLHASQMSRASAASEPSLLCRLALIGSHSLLVCKCVSVLDSLCFSTTDPNVTWKWLRCGSKQSIMLVIIYTRGYEMLRWQFRIHIGSEEISVFGRDSQIIRCFRDEKLLFKAVHFMIFQHHLNCVGTLIRAVNWQLLSANLNAVDENSDSAPIFYAVNQHGTRFILVQLSLNASPVVKIKKMQIESSKNFSNQHDFVIINYDKLIGSTFCQKIENLLIMMPN